MEKVSAVIHLKYIVVFLNFVVEENKRSETTFLAFFISYKLNG